MSTGKAERQLVNAGFVDVTGKAGELGAAGFGNSQRRESRAAIANDRRYRAKGLDIVQNRGALKRADYRRKRRPDTRDAAFAFERFEQRRFLAALVSARAGMGVGVKRKIRSLQVLA